MLYLPNIADYFSRSLHHRRTFRRILSSKASFGDSVPADVGVAPRDAMIHNDGTLATTRGSACRTAIAVTLQNSLAKPPKRASSYRLKPLQQVEAKAQQPSAPASAVPFWPSRSNVKSIVDFHNDLRYGGDLSRTDNGFAILSLLSSSVGLRDCRSILTRDTRKKGNVHWAEEICTLYSTLRTEERRAARLSGTWRESQATAYQKPQLKRTTMTRTTKMFSWAAL
jgi:hypothetical protein